MEPEKRKELNRILRGRKRTTALQILLVVIPVILGMLWFYPYTTVGLREGTAVSLTSQHSDEGSYLLMVVVLKNGKRVTATMGRRMGYKPGATVVLREKRNIYGALRYSFIRYEKG